MMLKYVDIEYIGWVTWSGFIWLRIREMAGSCEVIKGPSSSLKCGEFLD
jgi:hypothetical protein